MRLRAPRAGTVRWEQSGHPPHSPTAGTGHPSPAPRLHHPPAALRLPEWIFSRPKSAGMADPSPSAESRWGHQPARDSDGIAALPRGSRAAARPRPRSTFLGALSAPAPLDEPMATRERPPPSPRYGSVRGAPRDHPPTTGAPKPSGTHKLQRELFPREGFFFFLSFRP